MEEKKHELVSVIVPIYKVEDDLLDCVTNGGSIRESRADRGTVTEDGCSIGSSSIGF